MQLQAAKYNGSWWIIGLNATGPSFNVINNYNKKIHRKFNSKQLNDLCKQGYFAFSFGLWYGFIASGVVLTSTSAFSEAAFKPRYGLFKCIRLVYGIRLYNTVSSVTD